MENLYKEGITTITNAKCVEIKDNAVIIDRQGVLEEIPCDPIVVSIGSRLVIIRKYHLIVMKIIYLII